jgi:hypothetical protein
MSDVINHYDINPHSYILVQGIATYVMFQDRLFIQIAEIQEPETGARNCSYEKKDVSFDFITLLSERWWKCVEMVTVVGICWLVG